MTSANESNATDMLGAQNVPLDQIGRPPYSRCHVSEATVQEYRDALNDGAEFPAIVLFWDGEGYWLGDGEHRWHAFARAGREIINADVRRGGMREALLYSVGANAEHGLRRTNADKRHAVAILLKDSEWRKKSSRWIATACAVTHPFVESVRAELETVTSCDEREGMDGKVRHMPLRQAENDDAVDFDADAADGEPAASRLRLVPPARVDADAEALAVHEQTGRVIDALVADGADLKPLEGALINLLHRVQRLIAGRREQAKGR